MMVTLQTNYGDIKLELDTEGPNNTVQNFLAYAKNGYYEGTIFHRVINGFMIQGGGFDKNMKQKATQPSIPHEGKHSKHNKRGTIAMARTNDPHSATSQFFINVADNDFLNFSSETASGWGYCVFGKVVEGMDIVDQIKKVPTTSRSGHNDVPVEPVVIEKVIVE